jgi:hypothetical protein
MGAWFEQKVASLEVAPQVHQELVHLAIDLGADGDLFGGGDFPGGYRNQDNELSHFVLQHCK